ncbi:MAG: type II secretion system protein [Phycisphaerae bacterium]
MSEHQSNADDRRDLADRIVDLHLDRLEDEDRAAVESEISQSASAGEFSDRVGRALRPLDHWTAAPMPESLIGRTLERIQAAETSHETRNDTAGMASGPAPVGTGSTDTESSVFRYPRALKEILAVAACIGILICAAIPSIVELRERTQLNQCASNLGTIFQGTRMYQATFAGALPYAGRPSDASWLPMNEEKPFVSNSQNVYLLARLNFGPKPEHFVCPSNDEGKTMPSTELAKHHDFRRREEISYDTLNLSGPSPNLRPQAALAYAGDANPLFRRGRFDTSLDPSRTNSRVHGGEGQNVLMTDGRVEWLTTPIYGLHEDNIWLAGSIRQYEGSEHPRDMQDAHLVPGFPSTDPSVRALRAP